MRRFKLRSLVSVVLALAIPATLMAFGPLQGNSKSAKSKDENKEARGEVSDTVEILDLSARITITYPDLRRYAVGNNLTGLKPLPPGIRKNLARGKPMPPGIAKTRLPSSFVKKLPVYEGYEWKIAGTDLLLVLNADKIISDVLKDVFR